METLLKWVAAFHRPKCDLASGGNITDARNFGNTQNRIYERLIFKFKLKLPNL